MQVRRELARVYWEQDEGKLPMDTAKGKAYLLGQLVAVLKAEQADDGEIERRIAELERRLAQGLRNAEQRTPAPG